MTESETDAALTQRSPEWFAARLGRVTASRVADVVAKTKSGPSTSRANYMAELVAERLTGTTAERYTNSAMQWGTDHEPEARRLYALLEAQVDEVGFVQHPRIPMSGASPDGHVGEFGSVEIKCPLTATHIATLLGAAVDGKYQTQIQWQLACSQRRWCDFVSFDPRLPPNMQICIKRIERDPGRIAELEREVREFLAELDDTVSKLRAAYP